MFSVDNVLFSKEKNFLKLFLPYFVLDPQSPENCLNRDFNKINRITKIIFLCATLCSLCLCAEKYNPVNLFNLEK